jgi:hypothetical protein
MAVGIGNAGFAAAMDDAVVIDDQEVSRGPFDGHRYLTVNDLGEHATRLGSLTLCRRHTRWVISKANSMDARLKSPSEKRSAAPSDDPKPFL